MNRRILGVISAVEYRRSGQLIIRNHGAQILRICAEGRGGSTARQRARGCALGENLVPFFPIFGSANVTFRHFRVVADSFALPKLGACSC